jgi:hypothetical protein
MTVETSRLRSSTPRACRKCRKLGFSPTPKRSRAWDPFPAELAELELVTSGTGMDSASKSKAKTEADVVFTQDDFEAALKKATRKKD